MHRSQHPASSSQYPVARLAVRLLALAGLVAVLLTCLRGCDLEPISTPAAAMDLAVNDHADTTGLPARCGAVGADDLACGAEHADATGLPARCGGRSLTAVLSAGVVSASASHLTFS